MNQPKPVPEHIRKATADFFAKHATVVPDPPAEAVAVTLAELELMGLHDDPEWQGLSSSVKQYALAVGISDRHGEPTRCFVTGHQALIARADELERRFGVRPISISELLQIAQRERAE